MRRLFACILAACAPVAEDVVIDDVVPGMGVRTTVTDVEIAGVFHRPFRSDLDRGDTVVGECSATIAGVSLEDLVWRGEGSITASVPANLPLGFHDVVVTLGDRSGVLERGFEVTDNASPMLGAFGTPTPIAELSSPSNDDDPTMSADGLELFFNSNRPGGLGMADVWVSTRGSTAAPWGAPALVAGVNTADNETSPAIAADGLTLYLSSNRPGGPGGGDIWMSTRTSRTAPWSTPVLISELSTPAFDYAPAPLASGLAIVVTSTTSGPAKLYVATRASIADPWSAPAVIAELSDATDDEEGWIANQGRTIVFSSDRPGGMGSGDFYLATRPDASSPFGPATPLVELNTPSNDVDNWLSEDTRTLLFASDRSGDNEIYQATR